jgi:hypothetical protein
MGEPRDKEQKKTYRPPTVTEQGEAVELTKGDGSRADEPDGYMGGVRVPMLK